jgi:hypothetical protein
MKLLIALTAITSVLLGVASAHAEYFGNYVGGLPFASTPGVDDQLYVRQGGASRQLSAGTLFDGLPAANSTHNAIATTAIPATVNGFYTSGYSTAGDVGFGCLYLRGMMSGPGAIQSADGAY